MIVNYEKELIYNISTLVCLPIEYKDKLEIYEYNFKYIYLFESNYKSVDEFIEFVKFNNIKEILLIDYRLEYETIIESLENNVRVNLIFTCDLASLTSEYYRNQHDSIVKLYKNKKINRLGLLDKNLYIITKMEYKNTYHVIFDFPIKKINKKKKAGIGLLNISEDPKHSYFNELSAIGILNEKANIVEFSGDINKFVKEFNIDTEEFKTMENVIANSEITLNVNFCNTDIYNFIKSMDSETICILGNNSVLNDNEYLKRNLQVKSDDDVNEIADKIENIKKNKDEILKEYSKFRKIYSSDSKKSISEFLGRNIERDECKKFDKLLTVGIPVYNVEKYVAATIESVLNSIDYKDTEIIIVNDGSTDNSPNIISQYKNKFPDLIKVINQENHGLGNARNVIMENSTGKYIASIDSDDTINKDFFKEARKYLENDIDIVLCDWLSIFKENEKYTTEAQDNNLQFENKYKKILYSTIMPSNCNKIIKKDLYTKIGIKFIEGLKYEDLGTNPIIMSKAETMKYINKPYYEYNIRKDSIMRTEVGLNMIDVLRILEDRLNKYVADTELDKQEFRAYVYFWRIEESILNQLYSLEKSKRDNMIDYIYNNIGDILEKLYRNNKYTDYFIDRVDEETKKYIKERNNILLNGNLKEYLDEKIAKKEYKILTPALILYNYDNR